MMHKKITITIDLMFPQNMPQLKLAAANNAIAFLLMMFEKNTVNVLEYHNIAVDGWTNIEETL